MPVIQKILKLLQIIQSFGEQVSWFCVIFCWMWHVKFFLWKQPKKIFLSLWLSTGTLCSALYFQALGNIPYSSRIKLCVKMLNASSEVQPHGKTSHENECSACLLCIVWQSVCVCRNSLRIDAETHVLSHLLILISWGARHRMQKLKGRNTVCVCAEDIY